MKVICIKTATDTPNKQIMNSDLTDYVSVGRSFWVYGLRFNRGVTYCYLFNGQHLFEAPLELFNIIENEVRSDWKVKVWNVEEITFWPEIFYLDGFLEGFAERNYEERQLFENLRIQ